MFEKLDSEEDFEEVGGDEVRASSATINHPSSLENAMTSVSQKSRKKVRAETAKRGGSRAIHDRKERQDLDFNSKV